MAQWQSSSTEWDRWDHWDQTLWICGKQWEVHATVFAKLVDCGDPGPIRTGDLPLRRGTLYPAELRGHWHRHRIPRPAEWTKRLKGHPQAGARKLVALISACVIDAERLVVPLRRR